MSRSSRRWLLGILIALSSMTAAACAGGDEPTEPAAQTATPTPTSALLGGPKPPAGLRPATTASPQAARYEWAEFVDEPTGTSAALPEGAEPIENAIPGPDGTIFQSRGYVFEHAEGVLGFEVIEEVATLDDLRKLAEFLAGSVDGNVGAVEEVEAGGAAGIDGEIRYGDDHLMLFRILVLNENRDVWNGFVGGPATDRERLESEFARLTISADLEQATDWVQVIDEPSGIVVDLPAEPEPRDWSGSVREYYTPTPSAGFEVADGWLDEAGLDAALAAMAPRVDGTVQDSWSAELFGYPGLEGEIRAGDALYLVRVVPVEDHVLTLVVAAHHSYRSFAEERLEQVAASVVLP
ncbi:hypothetical protein [Jiangella mangrovi]|uniref:Serine hydrolase n=1 Tax=Jiangella mangrovi TaxID=1524084 RepID=A0A7W9GQ81_9ACTN|nr:hypothetical protein [Jiangella mangrovi]MBB5788045.1 hypothetical protein [Jiangella mangrovi]